MHREVISVFGRLSALASCSVVLACQGGLTLPRDSEPSSLEAVSGSGQRGIVGSQLPDPLVVRVTDGADRPLSQVPLRFQTEVPAAVIQPAQVTTNDSGYAEVRVRLGETEGTQTFHAQLAEAPDLMTVFDVLAVPERPPDHGGGDHGPGHQGGHGHGHDGGKGDD